MRKMAKIYNNILEYFEIIFDEIDLRPSRKYLVMHMLYVVDIDGPYIKGRKWISTNVHCQSK